MASGQLECALLDIEQRCAAMSLALIQGEPDALELASASLKELVVNFSSVLHSQNAHLVSNPTIKRRIVAVRDILSTQRINLLRRTAPIESALNSLMPDNRSSTYAPQSGRYGASTRQTGAFKVLAA